MSDFKGTKGKWIQDDDRICDEKGYTIASSCYRNHAENKANAKLISCDPEMLEMLEDILDTIRECETPRLYEIEELIKKATDETEK